MHSADIKKYRALLEEKRAELSRKVRNRDQIAIQKAADEFDQVQLTAEREMAITNLDRESNLLRDVTAALARIEDGSYGVCARCEEDIKLKRLDAVPWAAYCVTCQEEVDRERQPGRAREDEELIDAA